MKKITIGSLADKYETKDIKIKDAAREASKNNPIERFCINKLHGFRNFKIDFDDSYKIILSENGQGKTTILKTINAIISENIAALRSINFESVEIKFKNSEQISINKEDLEYEPTSPAYKYMSKKVDQKILSEILSISTQRSTIAKKTQEIQKKFDEKNIKVSSLAVRDLISEKYESGVIFKNSSFFGEIKKNFNLKTLYLPTYRRIEDDIITPGAGEDHFTNEFMNFGLADVEKRLSDIRGETLTTSINSMTRINSEILTRLVNGLRISDADKSTIRENSGKIDLVLNRIGHNLSEKDKIKISSLVSTGEIFEGSTNATLIYFLSQMFEIFLDQKRSDEALNNFSKMCSKYFVNKKMIYDEKDLSVKIICRDSGNEIKLNELSSGEKQIVSLFSMLLLEQNKKFAVFFDEPELSLSVEWQKTIIHDLISTKNCSLLIAMTHSPFIFTDLSEYTSDLREYFN